MNNLALILTPHGVPHPKVCWPFNKDFIESKFDAISSSGSYFYMKQRYLGESKASENIKGGKITQWTGTEAQVSC